MRPPADSLRTRAAALAAVLGLASACGTGGPAGTPDPGPDDAAAPDLPAADDGEDGRDGPGRDVATDAAADEGPAADDAPAGDAPDDGPSPDPGPCTVYHRDGDGDGWGGTATLCLAAPQSPFTALQAGDCDDADPAVHPGAGEDCLTEWDDDCDGQDDARDALGCTTFRPDGDGDGHGPDEGSQCWCRAPPGLPALLGGDCDDGDGRVHPGAAEACNGIDDDCDDAVDEDGACPEVAWYCDADGDGHRSLPATGTCASFACVPEGCATGPGDDCDDGDRQVHPGAAEACNGVDDDCDDGADEDGACGPLPYHCDRDGDGARAAAPTGTCAAFGCVPEGCSAEAGPDCDDGDPDVHPGAPEACNGIDDDCSDGADEDGACPEVAFHCDRDGDGHAAAAPSGTCARFACVPDGCGAEAGDDCDDRNADVHPGATEACNGRDDDCDGRTDPGVACPSRDWYCDRDGDGSVARTPTGTCRGLDCVPAGCGEVPGDDCDDGDDGVRPGAPERCNGRDDDCDGAPEGPGVCPTLLWHCDLDRDGHVSAEPSGACAAFDCVPAGCGLLPGDDCNDADGAVHPGVPEDCATPADDDCDGSADAVGAAGCVPWYPDADGDGHGPDGAGSRCRCAADDVFRAPEAGDCDDGDPARNPHAPEACNGVDDDCDGDTDEGDVCLAIAYYCDGDGDFYVAAIPAGRCPDLACVPEGCRTTPGRDCDDGDPAVHPGAVEDCATAADDDCNGSLDARDAPHCTAWHRDLDQDGWGLAGDVQCRCAPSAPWTAPPDRAGDCADSNPAIHPGAAEACNGIDDDCSGDADPPGTCPATPYHCDRDRDGHAGTQAAGQCASWGCVPAGCSAVPGDDCDDADPAVHPGQADPCNGLDDDCDGTTDGPGACPARTFHCDGDGDGHASLEPVGTCAAWLCVPAGCSESPGDDCRDGDPAVHPGAPEACNGVDDDCDGATDGPGVCPAVSWFCDADGDGHASLAPTGTCDRFGCVPAACGTVPGDDCNDGDPAVHPGAPEVCNAVDDDCSGAVDDSDSCPRTTFFCDRDGDGHRALAPTGTCRTANCVPAGCATDPGDDCDDGRADVRPGVRDGCNGVDDDCDGATDDGNCVIDGRCVDAGAPHPADPCLRCAPAVDPAAWTSSEGLACDDGLESTVQDTCVSGACRGLPVDCFQGLPFPAAHRVQSLKVGTDGTPGQGLDVDGNPATCRPLGTNGDGTPLCSGGVDNQMSLVDEVVNPALAQQLDNGWLHLLAAFDPVEGAPFPLFFYLGGLSDLDPACDFRAPGCRYVVDVGQFDGACTPLNRMEGATLVGDRLAAGGPGAAIPLTVPLVGTTAVTVTLYAARLEAAVTRDAAGVSGFQGILAGALSRDELLAAVDRVPAAELPLPPDQVKALLGALLQPDIDADGNGTKESISLGMPCRADRASIVGVFQR